MQLLHIDSAITGAQSVSRQLSRQVVDSWVAAHPGTQVTHLDLVTHAPAHLTQDALALRMGQTENLSEAQKRENAVTEGLLQQFLAADVIVIGAPLYNFSIPTQLKAWIDRLAQPGRTFRYTASGIFIVKLNRVAGRPQAAIVGYKNRADNFLAALGPFLTLRRFLRQDRVACYSPFVEEVHDLIIIGDHAGNVSLRGFCVMGGDEGFHLNFGDAWRRDGCGWRRSQNGRVFW